MRSKRLTKIIRDTRIFIATIEWWNTNRTDAEPMDCEPERLLLAVAEKLDAETDPAKYEVLSGEMVRLANRAVAARRGCRDEGRNVDRSERAKMVYGVSRLGNRTTDQSQSASHASEGQQEEEEGQIVKCGYHTRHAYIPGTKTCRRCGYIKVFVPPNERPISERDDPLASGYTAFAADKGLHTNPFVRGTVAYKTWIEGWYEGERMSKLKVVI